MLALATSADLPQLDGDDQLLLQAFLNKNIPAQAVIWSDPSIDWSQFDCCIIRSTWDYTHHLPAYRIWLQQVSKQTRLLNPAALVEWNLDKQYLKDLEAAGLPIVPTLWAHTLDDQFLAQAKQDFQCEQFILKPSVSASGRNTFRIRRGELSQPGYIQSLELDQSCLEGIWMLQPYFASVETLGEISLIFWDQQFLHAVVKNPAPREFRVQPQFGGLMQPYQSSNEIQELAQHALATAPTDWLYARVDFIQSPQGTWCISELEMIEPSLYFRLFPESLSKAVATFQPARV